jgi:hypothetical protein
MTVFWPISSRWRYFYRLVGPGGIFDRFSAVRFVRARANPAGRLPISASIVINSCDSHFRSHGSGICLFVSSLFAVFCHTTLNEWSVDGSWIKITNSPTETWTSARRTWTQGLEKVHYIPCKSKKICIESVETWSFWDRALRQMQKVHLIAKQSTLWPHRVLRVENKWTYYFSYWTSKVGSTSL